MDCKECHERFRADKIIEDWCAENNFELGSSADAMSQEEIARRAGISQSAVANKLRLLRFSHEEQRLILSAQLTERHARALLRLTSFSQIERAISIIAEKRLTVVFLPALSAMKPERKVIEA